jgi:hypothetical protein
MVSTAVQGRGMHIGSVHVCGADSHFALGQTGSPAGQRHGSPVCVLPDDVRNVDLLVQPLRQATNDVSFVSITLAGCCRPL